MTQIMFNNPDYDISYQKRHPKHAEYSKIIENMFRKSDSFHFESTHLNIKAKFDFAYQYLEHMLSLSESKYESYLNKEFDFSIFLTLNNLIKLIKTSLNTLTPWHKIKFEQEVNTLIKKIDSYGKLNAETYDRICLKFLAEGFDIKYANLQSHNDQTLLEEYHSRENIPVSIFEDTFDLDIYTDIMNYEASALSYYELFVNNLDWHDSLHLHYFLSRLSEKKTYLDTVIVFSQCPNKKIALESKLYIEENFESLVSKTPTSNLLRYAIAFNHFEELLPILLRLKDAFSDRLPLHTNISEARACMVSGIPNTSRFEIGYKQGDIYYVFVASIDHSDNIPYVSAISSNSSEFIDEVMSEIVNQPIESEDDIQVYEFPVEALRLIITNAAHRAALSPLNLSTHGLCLYADLEIPLENPFPEGIEIDFLRKLTNREVMPDETNVPCDFADLTPVLHNELLTFSEFQSIVASTKGRDTELSLTLLKHILPRIIERTKLLVLTSYGISQYLTEKTLNDYTFKNDADMFFYVLGNPLATLVLLVRLNKLAAHGAHGLQEELDGILNLDAEDPEDRMALSAKLLKDFDCPIE